METISSDRNVRRILFLLSSCVVFLLFFRARWAFSINIVDETCYLEWTHKLIGASYPACYLKTHLPGIAILWLPAALLASLLGYLTGTGLEDWLLPLVALTSLLAWVASLFLINAIFGLLISKEHSPRLRAWIWPLIFLFNVPVLTYAARHTLMSHAGECLVALLTLYLLLNRRYTLAFVGAIWLTMIRLNDLPIVLMIVGKLIDDRKFSLRQTSQRQAMIVGAVTVCLLAALAYYIGFVSGHANVRLFDILHSVSPKAILQVLFTPEISPVLFLPFWFFALALATFHIRRLSWMSRAGLVWMYVLLIFFIGHTTSWNMDGPHFRFFIGSYVAVLVIWLELARRFRPSLAKASLVVLSVAAAWYTCFEWASCPTSYWMKIVTGSAFFEHYAAYNGSTTPAFLRKMVLEPIGLSPLGFTIYSWFSSSTVFSSLSQFKRYALSGPPLWILTATTAAVCTYLLLLARQLRLRLMSAHPGQSPTSQSQNVVTVSRAEKPTRDSDSERKRRAAKG